MGGPFKLWLLLRRDALLTLLLSKLRDMEPYAYLDLLWKRKNTRYFQIMITELLKISRKWLMFSDIFPCSTLSVMVKNMLLKRDALPVLRDGSVFCLWLLVSVTGWTYQYLIRASAA